MALVNVQMITREQLRMARAALKLTVRQLAALSGVTANTISRYENGSDALGDTLDKLRKTLEKAGVVFLAEDAHGGPGVRLKKGLG